MKLADAKQHVFDRFLDTWTGTALTQVVFENESSTSLDAGSSSWIRVSVREITGGQRTLGSEGNRKFRRFSRAFIQVFTPPDSGCSSGFSLAEQARELFEGESFEGLDFYNAQIDVLGMSGKWFYTLTQCDFNFDDTK